MWERWGSRGRTSAVGSGGNAHRKAALLIRQGLEADAAYMNECLQDYIDEMPAQYYWVHKRFKLRPGGEPSVYAEMDGK